MKVYLLWSGNEGIDLVEAVVTSKRVAEKWSAGKLRWYYTVTLDDPKGNAAYLLPKQRKPGPKGKK